MVRFEHMYLKIKPAGLIEILKTEGGAGMRNKIKGAVVDMASVNCLLDIKSHACFHH